MYMHRHTYVCMYVHMHIYIRVYVHTQVSRERYMHESNSEEVCSCADTKHRTPTKHLDLGAHSGAPAYWHLHLRFSDPSLERLSFPDKAAQLKRKYRGLLGR